MPIINKQKSKSENNDKIRVKYSATVLAARVSNWVVDPVHLLF